MSQQNAPAGAPSGAGIASAISTDLFKAAMRALAGGVAIVASGRAAERRGMTATAICSVSADPPSLLACINKSADTHPVILATRAFSINLLTTEHVALAERFSARDGSKGAERFNQGQWTAVSTGSPVLEGSLCSFDCELLQAHDAGTHTIFVGRIVDILLHASAAPLLYGNGSFGLLTPHR